MVIRNFLWRFFERTFAQIIELTVTIVLARILEPDAFGTVAIVTAIITILQIFVDGGFGSSLIQKKEADALDFSTVFLFNIFVCLIIYILLFLSAPFLSQIYMNKDLTKMVRVSGIVVLIAGIKNVQQAYISREMQFKKFFFSTLVGTIVSAIIGITMAIKGFGAWALIAQYLSNAAIDTVMVYITSAWSPSIQFSLDRLRGLYRFGWRILISNLIMTAYGSIRQLFIGRFFSASDLAYYNRGRSFPNAIVRNINTSIDSVLFPVMSKKQDDKEEIKGMVRRSVMVSNYVMAPFMMTLFFAANTIVTTVLTEKWLFCVPYLRIFAIIYMMQPIHTSNINAIKALGKSDYVLQIEIIKMAIGLIILLVCIPYGMKIVMIGYLINNFIDQIINSYPSAKILKYSYLCQLRDIAPNILLAIVSGMVVSIFERLNIELYAVFVMQILIAPLLYWGLTRIFKLESYKLVTKLITEFLDGKK